MSISLHITLRKKKIQLSFLKKHFYYLDWMLTIFNWKKKLREKQLRTTPQIAQALSNISGFSYFWKG